MGNGLGGSSLINYAFWTVLPAGGYDERARLVDDDDFSWKQMQQWLKKLDRYHSDADGPIQELFYPQKQDHGPDGAIDVEVPIVFEPEILSFLPDMKKAGSFVKL